MLGSPSTVWAHFSRDMVKALGKTLHSKVSFLECAGRICHVSLPAGWAVSAWLLAQSGKCSSTRSPLPLPCCCPRLERVCLCISLPSCWVGTAEWEPRAGAGSCVPGAKDGRKPHPLLALTTSGEINTLSVILRQFREMFSENLL